VHDLVLRRDRDAEQKEALASNIRTLRAEESQRILDFQRLQDKNVQLRNDLSTSEAQQRTTGISAKKAQAGTKDLKEQMLKMKSVLDQVRAKCISDIRKRDVELDKLKNHLSGLNRGKKESASGGMKINTINVQQRFNSSTGRNSQDNNAGEWTLENETNDFLAAVVNETSSENVALRKIVGDSMRYLSTLTGLDDQQPRKETTDIQNAIGIPSRYRARGVDDPAASKQAESLIPVQSLASSMSEVLSHCHTILRDPSFVPIEEVQARDEEIAKLRSGWEKMADRWKEAVGMMSQWRQKMLNDQEHSQNSSSAVPDHFDVEGLSGIAAFGRSVAMRPGGQPVLDPIEEEELTSMLMDYHSKIGNQSLISNDADVEQSHTIHDETLPEPDETGTPSQQPINIHADAGGEESELDISEKAPPQMIASPARRGIKLQKPAEAQLEQRQPLSNTNANPKKRKSTTTSSSPRKRRSVSPAAEPTSTKSRASTKPSSTMDSSMNMSIDTDPLHLDTLTSEVSGEEDDPFAPEAEAYTDAKLSRMTVAQKLAAVESEATEATEVIRRRQATTYASDDRRARDRGKGVTKAASKTMQMPRKGTASIKNAEKQGPRGTNRVKKAKDRRRSTLTPAELGSLMGR